MIRLMCGHLSSPAGVRMIHTPRLPTFAMVLITRYGVWLVIQDIIMERRGRTHWLLAMVPIVSTPMVRTWNFFLLRATIHGASVSLKSLMYLFLPQIIHTQLSLECQRDIMTKWA